METKDNVLAAIEAGEGLTPIYTESEKISLDLTQQGQMQTSGIRFEVLEAIKQPYKDNLPRIIQNNNITASEDKNNEATSANQSQR